jgi:hypothetical protein
MRAIICGTLALLTVTTANAQNSKDVLRDCKRSPSEVLAVDDNSSREF